MNRAVSQRLWRAQATSGREWEDNYASLGLLVRPHNKATGGLYPVRDFQIAPGGGLLAPVVVNVNVQALARFVMPNADVRLDIGYSSQTQTGEGPIGFTYYRWAITDQMGLEPVLVRKQQVTGAGGCCSYDVTGTIDDGVSVGVVNLQALPAGAYSLVAGSFLDYLTMGDIDDLQVLAWVCLFVPSFSETTGDAVVEWGAVLSPYARSGATVAGLSGSSGGSELVGGGSGLIPVLGP